MCYTTITESNLSNKTIRDLEQLIGTIPTKKLGDVCYSDLYQPEKLCIGLYFITSPDGTQLYIGKSTSCCIVERIAAHIDGRQDAYLNSFPKRVLTTQGKSITSSNINSIMPNILDWNLSVLFVEWQNLSYAQHLIHKAESLLIFDLQPQKGNCINGTNRNKPINIDTPIKNLIP